VQALLDALTQEQLPGLVDLTPGIRSLQIHFDPRRLPQGRLIGVLESLEPRLPAVDRVTVPSRIVHLPLSWEDPAALAAVEKYTRVVRPDAPWCPSNTEFIRRINGLPDVAEVKRIVYDASYFVLGLGDVYLGAPVATPLDPRHRLVTTKYNPARTWTPENAVGIGGAYLCIYGMEGPGGYQLVGRTVQVWNTWKSTDVFPPGRPWLLRFFDQIRFYPVTAHELLDLRAKFLHGDFSPRIEETTFAFADYQRFLIEKAPEIAAFKQRQQAAFDAERERWAAAGTPLAPPSVEDDGAPAAGPALEPGMVAVTSPVSGSVWKVLVEPGQAVKEGEPVAIVEAMKTEISVLASESGRVHAVAARPGALVAAGTAIVILAT
jgi:urea carboxylase